MGETVYFRTLSPPTDTGLVGGLLAVYGVLPDLWVLRLGNGAYATAGPSGNFTWSARYPVTRYNGATITVGNGTATVSPTPGTGRRCVYSFTSDIDLARQLQRDFLRSRQPFTLAGSAST